MNIDTLKHATDWFRVHSLKRLDDPSEKIDRRELVVSLDQYPIDFGLGPNPRRPDPKSRVAKEILQSLEEDGEDFHLLNRGITVLAKGLDYDTKTERVRLRLHESEEEESHYGILDGGNTNEKINDWRGELADEGAVDELKRRFVNMQVLVPRSSLMTSDVEELLNDIKEARNNSVQVKQKSLADARHHFDLLKNVLANQPYYSEISWREGEKGAIDVLQIIMMLMIFYPPFAEEAPDREPNGAYGRKEKCLDSFLAFSEKRGEELERWITIVPDLLELFDEMQLTFPTFLGGRFGKINEVRIFDERMYEKGTKKYRKTPSKTQYFFRDMKYEYPTAWLYPVYAALRVLVGPNAERTTVVWKRNPVEFWRDYGQEICARYDPHLRAAGYTPKKMATSAITYAAMKAAVSDLYKDAVLAAAGISA